MVSSILSNWLYINTSLSHCKKTWAGRTAGACGGEAGDPLASLGLKTIRGGLADKGWSSDWCGHAFLARMAYFMMGCEVGCPDGDCNWE